MLSNVYLVAAIIVGALFLQAYLAKTKSKIVGLILPGIFFINSIIRAISVDSMETIGQTLALAITTFVILNLPTIILLVIYISSRYGITRNRRW